MAETNNGKSIASMVLGIVSIPTSFIPLIGLVLGILALIFYKKAKRLIRENPSRYGGNGMAIAGLVTGIIGIILSLLYTAYWIFIISVLRSSFGSLYTL